MADPDPKCRHFGIFAKKSNKKSNPIFPILSNFSTFRLFPTFRLSDSTALVRTLMIRSAVLTTNLRLVEVAKGLLLLNVTRQFWWWFIEDDMGLI